MSNLGHAYVELRGITNRLERDIERALDPAVKRLGENISENISDSIRRGFNEVDASDLQLDVGQAGDAAGRRLKEQIEDNLRDDLRLRVNVDVDKAADDVDLLIDYIREKIRNADLNIDNLRLDEDAFQIAPVIDEAAMRHVRNRMEDLKEEYKEITASVHPDTNAVSAAGTNARLAWLTRPRTVSILPTINSGAMAGVVTALSALSGIRMTTNVLDDMWNMVRRLDESIPKITLMGSAVTYLGAFITSLVSDTSHLIVELGRLSGLLIPLPGIVAGFAVGIASLVAVFRDAGDHIGRIGDEFSALQDIMSAEFWERARDPILNFFDTILPTLRDELSDTAKALGDQFASLSNELTRALGDGSLEVMLRNLNTSIREASTYTAEYADIIAILGRHGSEYLPQLATWFGEISTRFRDFLLEAENNGELQRWTDQAIDNLGHLGSALWGAGRVFYELGSIAEEAGAATLESLAGALNGIADIIGREPFRSNLTAVFREAHDALIEIGRISGPAVTGFFENFARIVAQTFRTLAPAIGTAIREIATALSGPEFTRGFDAFVSGIGAGVTSLSASFVPLGRALGTVGTIIGEMARAFGPILANILTSVSTLVVGMEGPILSVVGFLTDLMTAFSELPASVQLGVAGLLAFNGPLRSLFASLSSKAFQQFHFDMDMARAKAQAAGTQISTMGRMAQVAGASVRFLGNMFKAALISSGIGIVVAAITTAIGHFVSKTSEAKQEVQDFADTLDELTGSFTDATKALVLDTLLEDLDDIDTENLDKAGVSISDAVKALEGGAGTTEAYQRELQALSGRLVEAADAEMDAYGNRTAAGQSYLDQALAVSDYRTQLAELSDSTLTAVEQERERTRILQELGVHQATNEANERAAAAATDARNASMGTQITTIGQLLNAQRELNGEVRSAAEAEAALEAAYDRATETIAQNGQAVKDNGAALDLSEEAGRRNQEALFGVADAALQNITAMEQSGASTEDMAAALEQSRVQFLGMALDAGLSSEAALALADDLGLIEGRRVAEIVADTTTARNDIEGFKAELDLETGELKIDGNVAPATMTLGELINGVNNTETEVTIAGKTLPAEMSVADFIAASREEEIALLVEADTAEAESGYSTFLDRQREKRIEAGVDVNTETAEAEYSTFTERQRARRLGLDVDVNTDAAAGDVEGVRTNVAEKPANLGVTVDQVQAAGQVQTLRNNVGETPASLSVEVDTSAVAPAVETARASVANSAATITINADGSLAATRRNELVASINNATGTMRYLADGSQAAARRRELVAAMGSTTATMRYLADGSQASARRTELINTFNRATATMSYKAEGRQASDRRRELIDTFNNSSATMKYLADGSQAAARRRELINSFNNSVATMTVRVRQVDTNANGNLYLPQVQQFARGGIRRGENHVAQIARGGVTRVWAEPETGGEAYIPLAMTKRLRSLRILEQVAKIMGHQLVPMQGRSIRAFEDGGILARRQATLLSRTTVNNGNMEGMDRRAASTERDSNRPINITNNISIDANGDVDVHTLAREVSREIMFTLGT